MIALFAVIVAFNFTAMAAEPEKKSDVYYGSEKGGFSLSFGVLPVINFVGNMFNGTVGQSFSGFGSVNPTVFNGTSLSGKYFISDKMTLMIGTGFNCLNNKSYVYNEDHTEKESISTTGSNEVMFMLGAGYLLRPGKRLQPVLGANVVYAYANKDYEKKDDREETNADFNHKTPSSTLGIIANLGVEFFLCKSVSMSAVLDMGLTGTTSRNKVDDWDEKHSYVTSKQVEFLTGKLGGNLAFNFYF